MVLEARKKYPREPRLEIPRARALAALGKNEEASELLRSLFLLLPGSWELHEAQAEVNENLGQKDLALNEYRKAIAILKHKFLESF